MTKLLAALAVPTLLLLAGCVAPPDETLGAASTTGTPAGESVRVEQGSLGNIAVVCGLPMGCAASPTTGETRLFPLEGNETSVANLTLAWTPASPRAANLRLQVRDAENAEVLAFAEGPSPLVLEYALAEAEGAGLEIAVSFPSAGAGPVTAQVRHDQKFELTIGMSP